MKNTNINKYIYIYIYINTPSPPKHHQHSQHRASQMRVSDNEDRHGAGFRLGREDGLRGTIAYDMGSYCRLLSFGTRT